MKVHRMEGILCSTLWFNYVIILIWVLHGMSLIDTLNSDFKILHPKPSQKYGDTSHAGMW